MKSDTPARERLLDAGVTLFSELSPAALFGGLSVSALARRARTTRATFYHHWPTLDAYLVDLARHAFDPDGARHHDAMQRLPGYLDPTTGRINAIRSASGNEARAVVSNPAFAMRLSLTASPSDPAIVSILQAFHEARDQVTVDSMHFLWDLWHRVPREPFTYESIAELWTSLMDGLSLRQRIDPDFDSATLFGNVIVALLPAISRDADDLTELDQWARTVDRFPTKSSFSHAAGQAAMTPQQRAKVGEAVLTAAFALLEERAWSEISVRDLAQTAGTDEAAVYDAFGSKAGVAALVLSQLTHRRIVDLPRSADPLEHLRQVMRTLRSVIRRHRMLARATLLTVTDNAPGATAETGTGLNFSFEVMADCIREAQQSGQIRADVPALPLALHWSRSILLEQVTIGVDGQEGFDLVDVLLTGVRTPAPPQ